MGFHQKSGLTYDVCIMYDDQIRKYKPGCVFFKDGLWTDSISPPNPSQEINLLSREEDAVNISIELIKICIIEYMKDSGYLTFKHTERP